MTWFRCGGSWIPTALKNRMNAVFNKKFGTSGQNYPSNQWPDDVNLLGPLPEGTASGSIAVIEDGSDTVPCVSLVCEINAKSSGGTPSNPIPLLGFTNVSAKQSKRNLFPLLDWYSDGYTLTDRGVTFEITNDGGIRITGKTTAENYSQFVIVSSTLTPYTEWQLYVPEGEYTISMSGMISNVSLVVSGGGNNGFPYAEVTSSLQSKTGTVTDSTKPFNYFIIRVRPTENDIDVTVYPQVEIGSVVHNFEPGEEPIVYSKELGRTVYFGNIDLISGLLTITGGSYTFSGNETWTQQMNVDVPMDKYYSSGPNSGYLVRDAKTPASNNVSVPIKTDIGDFSVAYNQLQNNADSICIATDSRIGIHSNLYTGAGTLRGVTIHYELKNYITVQLTGQEIMSIFGYNAFWNDSGNTSITYRRDIELALQAVSSSRGLMMASRPVTQLVGEESDPDQVNELVEDDETEQEGEDNAR